MTAAWKVAIGVAGALGIGLVAVSGFLRAEPGGSPSDEGTLPALVVSAGELAAHRAARPILVEASKRRLGRDATRAELQYLHGVAWLESNYGRGWKGAMANMNNWGAVSCNPATVPEPACVPGQTDHGSGGKAYTTGFRAYPTPVDGAADVVANVLVQRPRTEAALSSSTPASAFRASYAMRRERYYGGICYQTVAKYGQGAGEASFAHPDRDEGTIACEAETVEQHARKVFNTARAVAQALGEPLALKLGTLEDARAWWTDKAPVSGFDRPRALMLAAPFVEHWDSTERAG